MNATGETFPNAKVMTAIDARLTVFDQHKKDLLGMLCKEYERRPKSKPSVKSEPFDRNQAWRRLKFAAIAYLWREARVEQEQLTMPADDRVKLLLRLKNALAEARCKADEAMQAGLRGPLFMAWCEANGNPDLTDPIITRYDEAFDKTIDGLAALEAVASQAAEQVHRGRGRPGGTTVLPHDCIIALEATYRAITKRKAGAGPGPFARFVKEFLAALGRQSTEGSVITALKDAKKLEEVHPATSRWGRIDIIGKVIPSGSP